MKFFGVIVLLAVAASCQAETNVRSKRSTINANLLAMLESFRDTMETGNEDLGIPILSPYHNDQIDFSIAEDFATLEGSLTNLTVTGLSDYEVNTIAFSIIGLTFTFDLTFNNIYITTGYTVDGTIADLIPVYGTGDLKVHVGGLRASGTVGLSVSGGYLYIRTMTSAVSLETFEAKGTGFLNDDDISAVVSGVVTDMVPQLVVDYQTVITDAINTVVIDVANGILGTMTLAELLALIRG